MGQSSSNYNQNQNRSGGRAIGMGRTNNNSNNNNNNNNKYNSSSKERYQQTRPLYDKSKSGPRQEGSYQPRTQRKGDLSSETRGKTGRNFDSKNHQFKKEKEKQRRRKAAEA